MAAAVSLPAPRALAARRPNVRAVAGLALALAGMALVLWVYRSEQPRTVAVLRAARDVPAGVVLQPGDLVAVSEPLSDSVARTLVPAGEQGALVGRALAQPLNAGDLVTRRQAVPALVRIPEGQRVYTIPVDPETGAGQVQAGDTVQVVVTTEPSQPGRARTETVVARATVYAVGRAAVGSSLFAETDRQDAAGSRLTWLALLLDDAQFQALAKARRTGELDVALLPPAPEGR